MLKYSIEYMCVYIEYMFLCLYMCVSGYMYLHITIDIDQGSCSQLVAILYCHIYKEARQSSPPDSKVRSLRVNFCVLQYIKEEGGRGTSL